MATITISEQNYQWLRQKAQAISLSPDMMVDKLLEALLNSGLAREGQELFTPLKLAELNHVWLTILQRLKAQPTPIDLLSLAGVGAEVWAKVNVNDYINQERDSWQR